MRSKAIESVNLRRLKDPKDRTVYREVAEEYQIGEQSLRLWVKKEDSLAASSSVADMSEAAMPPMTHLQMEAELKRLRSKVAKLQSENTLLKKAFVAMSSEWQE
ncbi:hypothetical protein [Devosia sp. Leaf64]|uniref:hypothetical protein n=1 Tax=Devosia sp. Leaf64 TaxID=1736229 RepID=UPI0012E14215|nr:hypothetical protein [Devosia sp. Leaf64]